jgi:hypothetical protein
MTKEALKLALEALENIERWLPTIGQKGLREYEADAITAIKEALAQPEFIKHEVKNAADWSEWVCPDPKNYLMKCCDCGLVHEAEFGVMRYKSETEREDCDVVDDPNLQAVFRMRRSEEWTPEDTAHRVGRLPMAQDYATKVGEDMVKLETEVSALHTEIDSLHKILITRAEQIVGLQDEIRNLTGEE